ncbi:hypothetical protein BDQ17DRAFT_1352183 [Cyathus striatus]|nr:hypothetical protein BDQ17DRAFT_1352183 [Cyathus striatus]
MSFTFNWPRFSDQFHYDAIQMLNTALNKGNKPPVIADKIEVVELEMGTQPPELEIRDIGDLTVDQFRGIFRLTYAGDAHLVLKTKVQANPLNHKQPDIHLMTGSRGMLAAKQPLVVPMLLRLSHFRLSSYVVLVVSKQKGITLVFKTDPLQNVDINSTFDSIAVIQKFIQREIEGQLRQILSQQWVKAKVEAPYLNKRPPPPSRSSAALDTMSAPDLSTPRINVSTAVGLQPHLARHHSLGAPSSPKRPRSVSGSSTIASAQPLSTLRSPSVMSHHTSTSPPFLTPKPENHASSENVTFPEIENFDPTYGLRPEGLPTKSVFRGFRSLFSPNKGLAELAEEPSEPSEFDDEEEAASFDFVDWEDTVPGVSPPLSMFGNGTTTERDATEYETIPAVGGGTITRPRIYHSQSAIQPVSDVKLASPPPGPHRSRSVVSSPLGRFPPATSFNPYFPEYPGSAYTRPAGYGGLGSSSSSVYQAPLSAPVYASRYGRPPSPNSNSTPPTLSSTSTGNNQLATPPSVDQDPQQTDISAEDADSPLYMRPRRLSVSSSVSSPVMGDPIIVLRPSINNSLHHLSTLSHSYHTLSPYTRSLSHFTVRSVPPRGQGVAGAPAGDRQPVRAKRKRIYRIGGQTKAPPSNEPRQAPRTPPPHSSSPVPPSEFDAEDMDRYFRSNEDLTGTSGGSRDANVHASTPHMRKRQVYGATMSR